MSLIEILTHFSTCAVAFATRLTNSTDLAEPPFPEDAYYMLGHDGQTVAIVPSRDLVSVRLGLTRDDCACDPASVFAPIVRALPPRT